MRLTVLFVIFILTLAKSSFAVKCDTNPCQLDAEFSPPNYNCIELSDTNDVICTCPNGQGRRNARCRICDSVFCGSNGICIEQQLRPGSYYVCGCTNATGNYINQGPCSGAITTPSPTVQPLICLNGGVYDAATRRCICRNGYTGVQCETVIGTDLCRRITCANGGVCNPVPTANNGFEAQCLCLNGYSGANCELIGLPCRCATNPCRNGGACEERSVGALRCAYCLCAPGFTGQYCERIYFSCSQSGLFTDLVNCKFGRYFQCIDRTAITRSCPRGLRFNAITQQCDDIGSCPS